MLLRANTNYSPYVPDGIMTRHCDVQPAQSTKRSGFCPYPSLAHMHICGLVLSCHLKMGHATDAGDQVR